MKPHFPPEPPCGSRVTDESGHSWVQYEPGIWMCQGCSPDHGAPSDDSLYWEWDEICDDATGGLWIQPFWREAS